MNKREMIDNPNSCLNRAHDDEPVFVLMGRDIASPGTILKWISERIQYGKNCFGDKQTEDARDVRFAMQQYQKELNQ